MKTDQITPTQLEALGDWIAENVMRYTRKTHYGVKIWQIPGSDECYFQLAGREPDCFADWHPQSNKEQAFMALEQCLKKVETMDAFDISMAIDLSSDEPYIICLNAADDRFDRQCVDSCVSAKTLELAICLFARKIFA